MIHAGQGLQEIDLLSVRYRHRVIRCYLAGCSEVDGDTVGGVITRFGYESDRDVVISAGVHLLLASLLASGWSHHGRLMTAA